MNQKTLSWVVGLNWLTTLVLLVVVLVGGNSQSEKVIVGGVTNYDSLTLGEDLVVTGVTSLTGTTTVTQSVDGLVVGGTISTAATGTVRTVYTNTTGPKMCDASTAFLLVRGSTANAPSQLWSLGTSTSAALASTNLIASSTVATGTTPLLVAPTASLFELVQGETLTAIFGDGVANASTTYLDTRTAEAGVWCQDLSI